MARSYERDRDEGRYRQEDDRGTFGSRYPDERDEESGGRYGRRGGYSERHRGMSEGYQATRDRGSRSYWDERDRAGGYYGGSSPGSSRQYSSGRYGGGSSESGQGYRGSERSGYGGAGSSESGYRVGYSEDEDYFTGSRGYTGSAYSGGRDDNDWSTRGTAGTPEGYGRSNYGSFEREGDEYRRFMGGEDRGRAGARNRSEDDERYTRGGGRARFGNRTGNDSPYEDDNDDRQRRSSEYEGRGGRSGGTGGWRSRE